MLGTLVVGCTLEDWLNALTAELFVAHFLGQIFYYVFMEIDP